MKDSRGYRYQLKEGKLRGFKQCLWLGIDCEVYGGKLQILLLSGGAILTLRLGWEHNGMKEIFFFPFRYYYYFIKKYEFTFKKNIIIETPFNIQKSQNS